MSYENFSYHVETMKKSKELNELTRALNSGIDADLIYKAFRQLFEVTMNSSLAKGKDGLNIDGLFTDSNTEEAIYSLLDIVKGYVKCNIGKSEAVEETVTLARNHYLTAVSEEERYRQTEYVQKLNKEAGGDLEQIRQLFWSTLKSNLTATVNELLN